MLDNESKRILEFIISKYKIYGDMKYTIHLQSEELNIEYSKLNGLCSALASSGYIKIVDLAKTSYSATKVLLTYEGLVFFEKEKLTKQLERKHFRHEWYIAVFSSITALIFGTASGVAASFIYNILTGR